MSIVQYNNKAVNYSGNFQLMGKLLPVHPPVLERKTLFANPSPPTPTPRDWIAGEIWNKFEHMRIRYLVPC
jgi:hypothetical protein